MAKTGLACACVACGSAPQPQSQPQDSFMELLSRSPSKPSTPQTFLEPPKGAWHGVDPAGGLHQGRSLQGFRVYGLGDLAKAQVGEACPIFGGLRVVTSGVVSRLTINITGHTLFWVLLDLLEFTHSSRGPRSSIRPRPLRTRLCQVPQHEILRWTEDSTWQVLVVIVGQPNLPKVLSPSAYKSGRLRFVVSLNCVFACLEVATHRRHVNMQARKLNP